MDSKSVGDDADQKAIGLQQSLRQEWSKDPIRGRFTLSVMVFFALYTQCGSTLVVVLHETRSWAWPVFTFVTMTALVSLGAFITFQVGRLITIALA